MKALTISSIAIIILILSWFLFFTYTESVINTLCEDINDITIYNVRNESWDWAAKSYNDIHDSWERYRMIANPFISKEDLNSIEYTFERVENYIESKEKTSAVNELAYLAKQLYFLYYNEKVTIANII